MGVREVSEMVGCRASIVRGWAAGRLPCSCTGAPPRGRMAPLPGEGGEGAVTDGERAAYRGRDDGVFDSLLFTGWGWYRFSVPFSLGCKG